MHALGSAAEGQPSPKLGTPAHCTGALARTAAHLGWEVVFRQLGRKNGVLRVPPQIPVGCGALTVLCLHASHVPRGCSPEALSRGTAQLKTSQREAHPGCARTPRTQRHRAGGRLEGGVTRATFSSQPTSRQSRGLATGQLPLATPAGSVVGGAGAGSSPEVVWTSCGCQNVPPNYAVLISLC